MINILIIIATAALITAAWQAIADRVREQSREPRQLEPRLP